MGKKTVRLNEEGLRRLVWKILFERDGNNEPLVLDDPTYNGRISYMGNPGKPGKGNYDNDLGIFYNSRANAIRNAGRVTSADNGNHSPMDKVAMPSPEDNTGKLFTASMKYIPINDNRYRRLALKYFGKCNMENGNLPNTIDNYFTADPQMKGTQYNFRTAFDVLMGNTGVLRNSRLDRKEGQLVSKYSKHYVDGWKCIYPESQKSRKGIILFLLNGKWNLFKPDSLLNPREVDIPSDEALEYSNPSLFEKVTAPLENLKSIENGNATTFKKARRRNSHPKWVDTLPTTYKRALMSYARSNGWDSVPEYVKDLPRKEFIDFLNGRVSNCSLKY